MLELEEKESKRIERLKNGKRQSNNNKNTEKSMKSGFPREKLLLLKLKLLEKLLKVAKNLILKQLILNQK